MLLALWPALWGSRGRASAVAADDSVSAAAVRAIGAQGVFSEASDVLAAVGVLSPVFITDTDALQRPVNAIMAGNVPIKAGGRGWDIRPPNLRTRTVMTGTGTRRLTGGKPSFTTKTDKRGYD